MDPNSSPHRAVRDRPQWLTPAGWIATVVILIVGILAGAVLVSSATDREDGSLASANAANPRPPAASALPVPEQISAPATPGDAKDGAAPATELCDLPAVRAALSSLDDAAVIAAAGGGEAFRRAVVGGAAPCIDLRDPNHAWFVVNKTLPMDPIDYGPDDIVQPEGVRNGASAYVRSDVAASLTAMAAAANEAGAGQLGIQNAYRGYSVQQRIHNQKVSSLGKEAGEKLAARPGYSEHQSGIAADVMSCANGCGTSEAFGGTPLSSWVIEHGWEFGWIVRYEEGFTPITGYDAEAWHLRYIGTDLATAYHAGGFHTLEEFFGLPAAPAYLD